MSSVPVFIEKNEDDQSFLMTETLAKIYLEQKKYQKAIQAYEILILKYPEKSSLFADRISNIKMLQNYNS
ncbi:tetratricopeptide repeat protein [Myroides ceti]|nr:tetratricopeptide repeat protein [Paenimyroides ceti]MDN3709330.1 tetratricopeptide repeat protein [Paenimyroides ceti]